MSPQQEQRVFSSTGEVAADPEQVFELIADPARQAPWDGNDNLSEAVVGQRAHSVEDVVVMTLTTGSVRESRVVEFKEGRRIAWRPAELGQTTARAPVEMGTTADRPCTHAGTHTYDWTQLTDENRLSRARATTADKLQASLDGGVSHFL